MNGETIVVVRTHAVTWTYPHHDWLTCSRAPEFDPRGRRERGPVRGAKWQAWECSNPDCDALALVLVAAIDTMVESWLPPPEPATIDPERSEP